MQVLTIKMMKMGSVADKVNWQKIVVSLLVLLIHSKAFAAGKIYEKKAEITCNGTKIQVVTKCDDIGLADTALCGEQKLIFADTKSGKVVKTPSYGKPYNKEFDGTGIANAWKCVKGKKETYLTLWYSTGGNCEECEWQGILDLRGNRIATNIDKKKRSKFVSKWKKLGLPALRGDDFEVIPIKKEE